MVPHMARWSHISMVPTHGHVSIISMVPTHDQVVSYKYGPHTWPGGLI
jgi:hypothetical protein